MTQVIVVTLVHGGEVTACKVFDDQMREEAVAYWEGLNSGKGRHDEARISIEDVIGAEP
jgi:hypothetical protein